MKFTTSVHVAEKVIKDYSKDSYFRVIVLKNSKGLIGGYILQPSIPDSPIPYLDSNGNILTSFHIFGTDEEKSKAQSIIEKLRKEFPLEEPLNINHNDKKSK